jgi:hypothetical protein
MRYGAKPRAGSWTIWGRADYADEWTPDVVLVGTPSHGGFWVAPEVWKELDGELRAFATKWGHGELGWFEEDCAAWKLIQARPELLQIHEEQVELARRTRATLEREEREAWEPDRMKGKKLQETKDSRKKGVRFFTFTRRFEDAPRGHC